MPRFRRRAASMGDIELQGASQSGDANKHKNADEKDAYTTILECWFGLSNQELRGWYPGARSVCCYLETCFLPLLSDEYAVVWHQLDRQRPRVAADCWRLFSDTCAAVRNSQDESTSIEDVWKRVCAQNMGPLSPSTPSPSPSPRRGGPPLSHKAFDACYISVFSILCWATMALQPKLSWSDFKEQPGLMVCPRGLDHDFQPIQSSVQRPIHAIFRQFCRAMSRSRWRRPIGEARTERPAALEVACLNFASLRDIAKINPLWVSDLASHLDFDATTRQLSVYRFPTFCALSCVGEEKGLSVPVFRDLLRELYSSRITTTAEPIQDPYNHTQLHQEIILSYRLLFGQKHASRRLAKIALKKLREERRADEYDELLDLLCAHPHDKKIRQLPASLWPVTCRSFDGHVQEQGSYSSQDDFPLFGQRLAKLQEFTLRQQPSELWDLWRDRRNPLQWYTFWAVLVFGGISILLGILQLGVGIAQLAVALRSPVG
ncbi:hypothetical protein B0T17DRAFT_110878 [Bombardia bombarda]|uniref:Uncharacterized protein n=1 Tax=Bombardia bombarda TaxID=252184 RepID=A0AA39WAJ5_9PEZI|nr:hypothetical protein B0T17DRAFT_110878 [Bombardia bombarda]